MSTAFPLPTEPSKTEVLASVLAQLILWRLEIEASYQAADLDPDNFENFIFDLACLIQAQAQPDTETDPTRVAIELVGDLVTEWEASGATIQDPDQAQAQETPDHD